jgi:hypothetical protein
MPKPTKKKRSESEVVSEVMLRSAALAYAEVANLDPSDPRWRRCWRALRLAATGMVAAMASAQSTPSGPARAVPAPVPASSMG